MRLVIIGAGDHGRVLADLARAAGHEPVGFVEPADDAAERVVDGLPVLGNLAQPAAWMLPGLGFTIGLGNNRQRAAVFDRCTGLGLEPAALVHPSAVVLGGAEIDPGAQVCAGAVVGLAARIGRDVVVNTGATIDHDDVLGEHAFVGPGAHLAGNVTVETGAHVGLGALVREGIRIGAWAYVVAGGVVVRDVAPSVRVAGVPARPMDEPEESTP
jgi:UDP-perosamine 4-acetyltransferase